MHNSGDIIYIEDHLDWVRTFNLLEVFEFGLNRKTHHYENVIDAFREVLFDDYIEDKLIGVLNDLHLSTGQVGIGIGLNPELINELVGFIDPEKIRSRVFISDNETDGILAGSHFLEAIALASSEFSEIEKPQIIALMSSNIEDVVERNPARLNFWKESGIDAVNKADYPIAIIWAAYRIGSNNRISFKEFYHKLAGIEYSDRNLYNEKAKEIRDGLAEILIHVGDGLEGDQKGLLLRLPLDEIHKLLEIGRRTFRERDYSLIPKCFDELSTKYPLREGRGGSAETF